MDNKLQAKFLELNHALLDYYGTFEDQIGYHATTYKLFTNIQQTISELHKYHTLYKED